MNKYLYDKLKNRKTCIFILLISILGFLLRVYRLGGPSLWYDELDIVRNIDYPVVKIMANLSRSSMTPLYYIIMNFWVRFFGNSEFSLRFPSVIFSVLSIIFIFKLSKDLFGEKVGIFSALFLSISPYSIYYAQETKMYSMLWLFAILSFIFFNKFIKDNKINSLLPCAIFSAICIYTMYIGFVFILIQNILFFSFFDAKKLKKWLYGQFMVVLLFLPWIDKFKYSIINAPAIAAWIPKVDNYFKLVFYDLFLITTTGVIRYNLLIDLIEPGIYCFLIISGIVNLTNTNQRRYAITFTRNDCMLFAWIIVPIAAFILFNTIVTPLFCMRTTRYIGFIHIPLIILISKGINKYNIKFKTILLIFILVMTFLYRLYPLYQYDYRILHRDNWRLLLNQLHQRANNNSLILTKLPYRMVNYYNKGYEIKPLKEDMSVLNGKAFDKNIDSIFVVYRFKGSIDKEALQGKIKEYKLEEDYFEDPMGFLWFKRRQ